MAEVGAEVLRYTGEIMFKKFIVTLTALAVLGCSGGATAPGPTAENARKVTKGMSETVWAKLPYGEEIATTRSSIRTNLECLFVSHPMVGNSL